MAEIIQARVQQKKDTEANWLANPIILLDGEQAFVVNSLGIPINFKIGDGTKTFADLPYWIDYAANVVVNAPAPGGTLPDPGSAGKVMILPGGTYTQPGGGTVTAPANAFNVYFWDGTSWTLTLSVVLSVDLTGYTTKTEFDAFKSSVEAVDAPLIPSDDISTYTLSSNSTRTRTNKSTLTVAHEVTKIQVNIVTIGNGTLTLKHLKTTGTDTGFAEHTIVKTGITSTGVLTLVAGVDFTAFTPAIGDHFGYDVSSTTAVIGHKTKTAGSYSSATLIGSTPVSLGTNADIELGIAVYYAGLTGRVQNVESTLSPTATNPVIKKSSVQFSKDISLPVNQNRFSAGTIISGSYINSTGGISVNAARAYISIPIDAVTYTQLFVAGIRARKSNAGDQLYRFVSGSSTVVAFGNKGYGADYSLAIPSGATKFEANILFEGDIANEAYGNAYVGYSSQAFFTGLLGYKAQTETAYPLYFYEFNPTGGNSDAPGNASTQPNTPSGRMMVYTNYKSDGKSIYYAGFTIDHININNPGLSDNVRANLWRIYEAFDYVYDPVANTMTKITANRLLSTGENEFALREVGTKDYTGGYHGDEVLTTRTVSGSTVSNINFYADNTLIPLTASIALTPCSQFRYQQGTNMLQTAPSGQPNGPDTPIIEHWKSVGFVTGGYEVLNFLKFIQTTGVKYFDSVPAALFCIANMSYYYGDSIPYTALTHGTDVLLNLSRDLDTLYYYNPTTKLGASAKSWMTKVTSGTTDITDDYNRNILQLTQRDRAEDNKYYRWSSGTGAGSSAEIPMSNGNVIVAYGKVIFTK